MEKLVVEHASKIDTAQKVWSEEEINKGLNETVTPSTFTVIAIIFNLAYRLITKIFFKIFSSNGISSIKSDDCQPVSNNQNTIIVKKNE